MLVGCSAAREQQGAALPMALSKITAQMARRMDHFYELVNSKTAEQQVLEPTFER
jgi:hypothetical protein